MNDAQSSTQSMSASSAQVVSAKVQYSGSSQVNTESTNSACNNNDNDISQAEQGENLNDNFCYKI